MEAVISELERVFNQHMSAPLSEYLSPISAENPTGSYLADEEVYQRIQAARVQDDSSTPRGVWDIELRSADWEAVSKGCLTTLAHQSKDLQLAIWLLEARLHTDGFGALAPCLHLITELSHQFWPDMHPCSNEADLEHRINLFAWINTKLILALKQVPISARVDTEVNYSWTDWELALRNTQLKQAHPETKFDPKDLDVERVSMNINQTPVTFYQSLYADLELALLAADRLVYLLDAKLAGESPSMADFIGTLEKIAGLAYQQLEQRGSHLRPIEDTSADGLQNEDSMQIHSSVTEATQSLQSRQDAYHALRSIADYLVQDDPHSPAPYLIYKAIDWGQMNTSQLYQELFVQQQGHINIFDMLGIQQKDASPDALHS